MKKEKNKKNTELIKKNLEIILKDKKNKEVLKRLSKK